MPCSGSESGTGSRSVSDLGWALLRDRMVGAAILFVIGFGLGIWSGVGFRDRNVVRDRIPIFSMRSVLLNPCCPGLGDALGRSLPPESGAHPGRGVDQPRAKTRTTTTPGPGLGPHRGEDQPVGPSRGRKRCWSGATEGNKKQHVPRFRGRNHLA